MLRSALFFLIVPTSLVAQDVDKCLTPHIIEAYHAGVRLKTLKQNDDGMRTMAVYLSPSGKFQINYETTGFDAVPSTDLNLNGIPDYVERTAEYADYSYQLQVVEQGFRDPIGLTPYQIYFEDLDYYGYTQPVGGTTYIVVHSNFIGFPPNDDPEGDILGALKVTVAHEFKHAIQYATNFWAGDAGRVDWVEMDATMMEEITYPEVNDYYNYLESTGQRASIFKNPNRSTPGAYYHVTWMLYYAETYGISFWVDVWDRVVVNGNQMIATIRQVLTTLDVSYAESLAENHAWHFASGNQARGTYGFEASHEYPNPVVTNRVAFPDSLMPNESLNRTAARYYKITRPEAVFGPISISVVHSEATTGVAILGYMEDGSIEEIIRRGDSSGAILVSTPWSWNDLDFLGLVIANGSEFNNNSVQYRIDSETVPEIPTLPQNYPNPFNPITQIEFTIPDRRFVRLDVFDALGRHVTTLVDEERNAGRYQIPFRSDGLASGVYIYRLIAGGQLLTGKMTLLR
jgi:hypothetical protein